MTAIPHIDVRDLGSVRRAAKAGASRDDGQVLLGDDWIAPEEAADAAEPTDRRTLITLRRSPLARKIITFNLVALIILVAGMMYLAPARDNLVGQWSSAMATEAELIADVFEVAAPRSVPVNLATGDGVNVAAILQGIDLRAGSVLRILDTAGQQVAQAETAEPPAPSGIGTGTALTSLLNNAWALLARSAGQSDATADGLAGRRRAVLWMNMGTGCFR
jgi:two-component system, OmpR family, sensor histidine kinase ChvG